MGSCMGFHTPARWARPLLVLGARARSSVIPWQHVGALAAQTRALDWRKLASIPMHLEVLCFPESETASRRVGAGDRVLLGHLLHREAPRPRRRGLASRALIHLLPAIFAQEVPVAALLNGSLDRGGHAHGALEDLPEPATGARTFLTLLLLDRRAPH